MSGIFKNFSNLNDRKRVPPLPKILKAKNETVVADATDPAWKAGTLPLSYSRIVEAILRLRGVICQRQC